MLTLISQASLISYFPILLLTATFFVFFIGFVYGYSVSFIFGLKKTLTIGFFVVILSTILVLLLSGTIILTAPCTTAGEISNCNDNGYTITHVLANLMMLSSHLFINLVIGHLGVGFGLIFYFPCEWIILKYTKITIPKKAVAEMEAIKQSQQTITTGFLKLAQTEDKSKFETTSHLTAKRI